MTQTRPIGEVKSMHENNRRVTLGVVLSVTLAFSVAGCGAGSKASDPASEAEAPSNVEVCADAWNAEDGGKGLAYGTIANMRQAGKVYASIGLSKDYPDRCLLTAVQPDIGAAFQFSGSLDGGDWSQVGEGNANDLPDSVKGWNVEIADDGTLSVN